MEIPCFEFASGKTKSKYKAGVRINWIWIRWVDSISKSLWSRQIFEDCQEDSSSSAHWNLAFNLPVYVLENRERKVCFLLSSGFNTSFFCGISPFKGYSLFNTQTYLLDMIFVPLFSMPGEKWENKLNFAFPSLWRKSGA